MDTTTYVNELIVRLKPLYAPRALGCGGHDWTHCERMVLMADEFLRLFEFDRDEYAAAVWLHNTDHAPEFRERIEECGFRNFLSRALEDSPFSPEAATRIVDAVDEHWAKEDRPNEPGLRGALRLADKWDRFGVVGTNCGAAFRGARLLPYNPEHPFGYDDAGYERSLYCDYFKILEWYRDFPLIRKLVTRNPYRMRILLAIVRAWGSEIAAIYKVPNLVEKDIQKALGEYYNAWRP